MSAVIHRPATGLYRSDLPTTASAQRAISAALKAVRPATGRARSRLAIGIVALLVLLALASAKAVAQGEMLDQQREQFADVIKAQKAGQHKRAARLVAGLENYPLYPYYVYNDLKRRIWHFPSDEIRRFLTVNEGAYLADRLRSDWLAQLAYAKRWQEFLDFYRYQDDVVMRCRHIVARIRTGLMDSVFADTRAVWLSGESRPDECDPVFDHLYASRRLTDELIWQRIRLAMDAGKPGLARYLSGKLEDAGLKTLYGVWSRAHQDPARVLQGPRLEDSPRARELLIYAVRRLARRHVDRAQQLWLKLEPGYSFTSLESGAVRRALALAAARSDHKRRIELLDQVPHISVDEDIERYRIREAIAEGAWPELVRWTAVGPVSDFNPLRWRYWRARALERTGNPDEARAIYEALARERDYYGFLAADRIGLDYAFGHKPVDATTAELGALAAVPGIQRARELYRLDRPFQARREWYHELDRMPRRQLEVAAQLAGTWGWRDQAIFSLGRARAYDDLELRFPIPYADTVLEYANRRKLDPARMMAIIRSESAFVSDARSPAGALGLMQLMPATARETAKSIGLRLGNMRQLYRPRDNIALGSAYLARMLKRFGGHFAMAAAAYNAGPHRARRWQNKACTVADVWIDTIPFTETRRYVRRAYFYTAIYEWRLGREITRLSSVLPSIPAAGTASISSCET